MSQGNESVKLFEVYLDHSADKIEFKSIEDFTIKYLEFYRTFIKTADRNISQDDPPVITF
jgi:hypothetical protein